MPLQDSRANECLVFDMWIDQEHIRQSLNDHDDLFVSNEMKRSFHQPKMKQCD
jgi:hypothetical protein